MPFIYPLLRAATALPRTPSGGAYSIPLFLGAWMQLLNTLSALCT